MRWLIGFLVFFLVLGAAGLGAVGYVYWTFGRDLPDYQQLADYEPPTVTRVHAGDGRLLAEYAIEKRVFVPIGAIPPRVINAFVSAEDQRFYRHIGIDPAGIARAVVTNLRNLGTGARPVGASTITQQVAQNFLLTKEVSLTRKVKEAILSLRIERAYTKDKILEFYLNEIYLGFGSYGVAAASLNYFNKSLDDLTVAEAAFLAALPKAPNNYHPVRRPAAARARRDYVVRRMVEDGHISTAAAAQAMAGAVYVRQRDPTEFVRADYFAEEVRRVLVGWYGNDALYEGGLSVRTTLDPRLQDVARSALRRGLMAYDRRHGWRGPVARLDGFEDWAAKLAAVEPPAGTGAWRLAAVLDVTESAAPIGFPDGTRGTVPLAELTWARAWQPDQTRGPKVAQAADVLAPGDVVLVEPATGPEDAPYPPGSYGLRQIPEVAGAILALDPHTGRVLAMVGGYDYGISEFNRATQAWRQPGSAFKPFVYMAGLEGGFTPSTLILDAPFVIDQGGGQGKWKPANYTTKFYGPSPMRLGIEKSRNLMTVRLAQTIGMDRIATYAERFNVVEALPRQFSMALGAGETTLLRMVTAYAMIVNGGKRVTPTLIDRVQNRYGRTVHRHDGRPCEGCAAPGWHDQPPPELLDDREHVVDPRIAYQMVSMLNGVVERGTGRRIAELDRPLAGKTGTTNDFKDSWFVGFSPDLAVGVFVGFDQPRTLGRSESGSTVAAPIFKAFMAEALKGEPKIPFRIPPGIRLVRVNAESGLVAGPGERSTILEAFQPGSVPTAAGPVLDGGYDPTGSPVAGGSGIY